MTKIYVVKTAEYKENTMSISSVFTNRKKAEAYRDYWNLSMKDKYHFWISTYEINDADYTRTLESLKRKRGLK